MSKGRILKVLLASLPILLFPALACAQSIQPAADKPPASTQKAAKETKQKGRSTLIVFDLGMGSGVERSDAILLTELVIDRVTALGRYEVIGQKDIDMMLSWEQNKQLKGCNDTGCLVQIAGAMGANYYIEGSIGVIGDEYIITLKLVDATTVKIINRETKRAPHDKKILADTMERLIDNVMGVRRASLPGETAPAVSSGRYSKLKIPGMACTFAGLGVAAIGGVFNGLSAMEAGKADSAKSGKELDDAKAKAATYGNVAIAGYTVGGAAAIAGVVMWVISAKTPAKPAAGVSIDIAPSFGPEGGGLVVGGRF